MKKVLIVDDDASIIEVLRLYFEKEGYAVSVCMQGDKALSSFHASNPDIVILDLMLPGMDGYDVCREIRKNSNTPIIMLTARTDALDKIIGLELGADDYVAKPFEPKELHKCLAFHNHSILLEQVSKQYTHSNSSLFCTLYPKPSIMLD